MKNLLIVFALLAFVASACSTVQQPQGKKFEKKFEEKTKIKQGEVLKGAN